MAWVYAPVENEPDAEAVVAPARVAEVPYSKPLVVMAVAEPPVPMEVIPPLNVAVVVATLVGALTVTTGAVGPELAVNVTVDPLTTRTVLPARLVP